MFQRLFSKSKGKATILFLLKGTFFNTLGHQYLIRCFIRYLLQVSSFWRRGKCTRGLSPLQIKGFVILLHFSHQNVYILLLSKDYKDLFKQKQQIFFLLIIAFTPSILAENIENSRGKPQEEYTTFILKCNL